LTPIRIRGARRLGVERRDRSLKLIHPGATQSQRALEHPPPFAGLRPVPPRPVLIREQDELAALGTRLAPRVVEDHQREQPTHLRLVGHEDSEQPREPNRLVAQVHPNEPAGRRRVPFVEDQVEDREHGAEAVRECMVGRHSE
jgi:hypothetical protein